jgi:hypothetical protein
MTLAIMRTSLVVLVCTVTACSQHSAHDTPDAEMPDAPDAGPFTEAAHDTAPQVVPLGGPVMTSPKVLPIFFQNDSTVQPQVEMFISQLSTSTYWTTISQEYGVGALTYLPSIVSTDTPPTTDTALQTWIAGNADGTHAGWPKADGNTLYAVFLPAGVTLTASFGTSCVDFGGYHSEGKLADNVTKFIYALLPRCGTGTTTLDSLTAATSHEFLEASTDPFYYTDGQYQQTDNNHIIWTYAPGGELGDMCEYAASSFQRLVGNFLVQRTWSNASAAAGHDPCVPTLPTPYVGAAPVLPDMLSVGNVPTYGVNVGLNQSVTIEVELFSDAPSSVEWQLKATDVGALNNQPTTLSFSWDRTAGNNGDKLHLTITRTAQSSAQGPSEFVIGSHLNGMSVSLWWGYVGG